MDNFKIERVGSASGTVRNGCHTSDKILNENDYNFDDFCVEYGAFYASHNENKLATINRNVDSPEFCRLRCLEEVGCVRYTWVSNKRRGRGNSTSSPGRQKCILMSDGHYDTLLERKAVSGHVNGKCGQYSAQDTDICQCVELPRTRPFVIIASEDIELLDEPDADISVFDLLSGKLADLNSVQCPLGNVNRCILNKTLISEPRITKGPYCVDYNIFYEEDGEISRLEITQTPEECRLLCVQTPGCKFYSWFDTACSLKSSASWTPALEEGAVSGTVVGLCRDQPIDQLGFCDCQELDYTDYTLSEGAQLALIDSNSDSEGCPDGQGKRCYALQRNPNF